jgi:hypothetical protein
MKDWTLIAFVVCVLLLVMAAVYSCDPDEDEDEDVPTEPIGDDE